MRRVQVSGLIAAAVIVASSASLVNDAAAAPAPTPPGLADLFDRPLPAAQALGRLGGHRRALEVRNTDLGPAQVGHLLADSTTWADRGGRLFVVEPAAATRSDDPVLGAGGDPSLAFELQSRPGAARTIYLDFNGETIAGTAWNASYNGGNSYDAAPFDMDGNPSSFSTAERNVVTSVWQRVAEDYAPFDVNVTTKDPGAAAITRSGSTDQVYGTRVLISNTSIGYTTCNCGGVAYVGTFDLSSNHAYYQPAWVFQRGVGTSPKSIAEAASHEAGHNLGLSHDGTSTQGYYAGHGPWAPIMGVGYNRAISQWSKGEYSGASQLEDDLVVMQQNGAPLRADDHGNTDATATVLGTANVDVAGLIGQPDDVDVFTFTSAAGTVSLGASPAAVSPNLDLRLELRNERGEVVAADDPPVSSTGNDSATGLGATISVEVPAGTYTVRVDGVGFGNPLNTGYSDYGSIGRYSLSGTIPTSTEPPPPPPPTTPEPPNAVISATPISGTAPLTVSFSAAASTDPDNDIASYAWDFGDGATGSGLTASRTYMNTGATPIIRTVTLRVTDAGGRSSSAQTTVTVAPSGVDVTAVSVTGTRTSVTRATATVTVRNGATNPAGGVTVTGVWRRNGSQFRTSSATTGSTGTASVSSSSIRGARSGDIIQFCVTSLGGTGVSWNQSLSSASLCHTWTVR